MKDKVYPIIESDAVELNHEWLDQYEAHLRRGWDIACALVWLEYLEEQG